MTDDQWREAIKLLAEHGKSDDCAHRYSKALDEDGNEVLQVTVTEKLTTQQLIDCDKPMVPKNVLLADGTKIPTQVVVEPKPSPELLLVGTLEAQAPNKIARSLQSCFKTPIPGGAQIKPYQAGWVGTAGGMFYHAGKWWLLTNYHVAVGGRFGRGTRISQPDDDKPSVGTLKDWHPIKFNTGENRIDLAVIDVWDAVQEMHTFTDASHDPIGKLSQEIAVPKLGDAVHKCGRTTGYTRGKVTEIMATSYVDYGSEGTAKFIEQVVIQAPTGNFSAGGDSGSFIVTEDGNRLHSLLFAGGGRSTIANPFVFIREYARENL